MLDGHQRRPKETPHPTLSLVLTLPLLLILNLIKTEYWDRGGGNALCFVTLLCRETMIQLLSSDVVKCHHMGYLSHSTLPLPYPYCRVDMQDKKAVSNVQLSLPVTNKSRDCPYGTPCTNHPSWPAWVCSDPLDTRDKLGSEPCMQRFAVDEQWYMGYTHECSKYSGIAMKWIAPAKTKDTKDWVCEKKPT